MLTEHHDDSPVPADMDPVEWVRQRQAESEQLGDELARNTAERIEEADEANRQRHERNAELDQQMWDMVYEMRAENDARGA